MSKFWPEPDTAFLLFGCAFAHQSLISPEPSLLAYAIVPKSNELVRDPLEALRSVLSKTFYPLLCTGSTKEDR